MLGSVLLSIGAPLLSKVVGAAATAAAGPVVGGIATSVLGDLTSALGAPSSAEGDIVAAITKDPAAAAKVVADLEAKHGPSITSALQDNTPVDLAEASSASMFVAGARPAAMWLANAGLAYELIVRPLFSWVFSFAGLQGPPALPSEVWSADTQLLFALYGVRALEAFGGVARDSLSAPRAATANVIAKVVKKVSGR